GVEQCPGRKGIKNIYAWTSQLTIGQSRGRPVQCAAWARRCPDMDGAALMRPQRATGNGARRVTEARLQGESSVKKPLIIAALAILGTTAHAQDLPKTHLKVVGGLSNLTAYNDYEKPFWTKTVPELSNGQVTAEIKG